MGQKQSCKSNESPPSSSAVPSTLPTLEVPEKMKRKNRRVSVSAEADIEQEQYIPKKIPKTPEAVQRIKAAIATSFLFAGLEKEQTNEIIDAMEEKKVNSGDVIIKQHDLGDFFYIISSGKYEVFKKIDGEEKKVFEYDERGSFGELALMYNCPRAATVKAATDGLLWAVDRATFRHIIITNTARTRALYETFLLKVSLFENLTARERSLVADCLVPVTFHDGDIVILQGEMGDKMYLIEKGEAVATQILEETGNEIEVGRMKAGQFFGERALITKQPRAATVRAVGELKVAAMDRAAFERLLGPCQDIMQRHIQSYQTAAEIHRKSSMDSLNKSESKSSLTNVKVGGQTKAEVVMGADNMETTDVQSPVVAANNNAAVAVSEKSESGVADMSGVLLQSPAAEVQSSESSGKATQPVAIDAPAQPSEQPVDHPVEVPAAQPMDASLAAEASAAMGQAVDAVHAPEAPADN